MFRKQQLAPSRSERISGELAQARDVLLDNPKILRRQVNRVAALGDTNGYALALYTLAAGHRFEWTPEDWTAVLDKLDNCTMLVGDWLEALDAPPKRC